jgi:hypothetical protein
MKKLIVVIAAAVILGQSAGCAGAKVRGLTSQARGDVQSNNLADLGKMLDAQTPETRSVILTNAPEVKPAYERWQAMSPDERAAEEKAYAAENGVGQALEPEMTLDQSPAEVSAKLIEFCAKSGLAVSEVNPNMVACEGDADFGQMFAQMLFTPRYSSSPRQQIRFVIYQSEGKTKVRASGWVESQSAFGQVNKTEMSPKSERWMLDKALASTDVEQK